MMVKLTEKLRFFWSSLNLQEKLLALYILSFIDMRACPFMIGAKKIFYADIIFIFLLAVFLLKIIRDKEKISNIYLKKSLVMMPILFAVSFLHSINLKDSFIELAGLIYLITLFAVVSCIITTRRKLNMFLYLWLFTATCISLIGFFAFLAAMLTKDFHSPFLFYTAIEAMAHHFPRIHSTLNNANMFCTYLHVSLIFSFILFFSETSRRGKYLISVCMFILFIVALLTGSRRFTGLLLSIFLILCWYGRGRIISGLKYLIFLGLLLFFTASIITSIWVIFPVGIIKDEVAKTIALKIDYAYSLHFLQPVTSINMIKKHPFIGIGFGTYSSHFKENVDWQWLNSAFSFQPFPKAIKSVQDKTLIFDPHSAFLGVLAETGVIGFIGLLYFLGSYLTLLVKKINLSVKDEYGGIVSRCILAGFVGFLLIGLFTDILSMRHFWFLMAVGLCTRNLQNREAVNND